MKTVQKLFFIMVLGVSNYCSFQLGKNVVQTKVVEVMFDCIVATPDKPWEILHCFITDDLE